ncbi:MAG: 30S ribosomal protein S9 [Phycisphaerae bacterium]|nr:30S ribosomal protein S9 [Phycisphaerae bacterium]
MGPGQYCWGTGRRKSSVARVRIRPGSGKILINKKEMSDYFSLIKDRNDVTSALNATNTLDKYDVFVNANGGGTTGQAGAIKMGLARALISAEPGTESILRDGGFMTRDSRMVERKKYGFKKARKSFQFSKR